MQKSHTEALSARGGWLFLAAALLLSSLIWSGLFFIDADSNPWAGGSGMSPMLIVLFLAGGAVPSVLGILVAFGKGGGRGIVQLLGRVVPHGTDWGWAGLALVLAIAAGLLARLFGELLGATPPELNLSLAPQAAVMALAAALMEEFGWRGTAVPALRGAHSLLLTGLVVGLVWSVWHTVGGVWSVGPFFGNWFAAYYLTGIVATMVGAGLTAASLWSLGEGRLFPVIAFHVGFSSAANVFTPSAGTPAGAVVIATCFAVLHVLIGVFFYRMAQGRQPAIAR